MSAQITVRSGPNSATIPGGQTVDEIRTAFEGAFNIDPSASARLNGIAVEGEDVVGEGVLSFRVPMGEKG